MYIYMMCSYCVFYFLSAAFFILPSSSRFRKPPYQPAIIIYVLLVSCDVISGRRVYRFFRFSEKNFENFEPRLQCRRGVIFDLKQQVVDGTFRPVFLPENTRTQDRKKINTNVRLLVVFIFDPNLNVISRVLSRSKRVAKSDGRSPLVSSVAIIKRAVT